MAGRDINGMQARNWKKADTSAVLSHSVKSKSDNVELFSAIKEVVADAVETIRGDAWDDKYRSVVDMIMSRVRHALEELDGGIDTSQLAEKLSDAVSDKLSDVLLGGNAKLSDVSVGELTGIIQQSLDELIAQENNQPPGKSSQSAETADAKGGEQETAIADNVESQQTDVQSTIQRVGDSLRRLDAITYSPGYVDSIRTFAKNIDDQINGVQIFQDLDEVDVSSIRGTDPVGKYIMLAQEKLQLIYEKIQKYTDVIKTRSSQYEGEVKKRQTPVRKRESRQKGLSMSSYGVHAMYLDYMQQSVHNTTAEVGNLGGSVSVAQAATMALLNKIYKLVKPKSIIDKIIDWIKDRIIKKAINKLIMRLFDNCPIVQYFKERLGPKFKEIKDKILNKIKTVFKGILAIFKAGFKIVKKIIGSIWKGLKKVFMKAVRGVLKSIKTVLGLIYKLAKGLGKLLWGAIKAIYGFFKNMFKSFLGKLKGKFTKFFGKLKGAFSKIKNFFKKPGEIFKRAKGFFKNIGTKLKNFAKGAKNFMSNLKKKAINALKNIASKIKNVFKSVVKAVKNAVKKIVKTIVKKIASFFKKIFVKIMKKIGFGIAKKMAKKKAKKLGMKIIINFVKKFAVKLIAKLATKIAATAAVNVIPILGQIISICMMIWTIVDTIMMVWDIYALFRDNPGLMDIVKEQVAEWASKAFSFFKDLAKWAANLFSNLMTAFKAMFHSVGDALFASNKRMNQTRMQTLDSLRSLTLKLMRNYRSKYAERPPDPVETRYKKLMGINQRVSILLFRIQTENNKLAEEDDSWWRDTDAMTEWIKERYRYFVELFQLLGENGIFFTKPAQYYSEYFVKMARDRVEAEKKRLKEQLDEAERQKELDRYRGLRLNFAGLKDLLQKMGSIVKERQEKLEELKTKISSESAAAREKLEEMYPKEMEEYDENNFRDDGNDEEEDAA